MYIRKNFQARTALFFFIAAGNLMLGALPALAQTDAGVLRQQIESQLIPAPAPVLAPSPSPKPSSSPVSGLSVILVGVTFNGNTLLSREQLLEVVAPWLQRPLAFADLQQAEDAVAYAYRQAGWIVSTTLPHQDLTDGQLTINIVEARMGQVLMQNPDEEVLPGAANRVVPFFTQALPSGQFLNANALDRALLLADDLAGVSVAGSLQAGQNSGETDLQLQVQPEPRFFGDAGIDSAGARSTGNVRLRANATFNLPSLIGDQVSTNLIHTLGSDYSRLGYAMPLGSGGWRMGANISTLTYKVITADLGAAEIKGNSNSVGFDASYPMIRSRERNLYLSLNQDHKTFKNESNGSVSTQYATGAAGFGLSGNAFDGFFGGGATSGSVNFVRGVVNLDNSPNKAADAATTQTAGSFQKSRWLLSREQNLSSEWNFFAAWAGQVANKNLDSSEKFFLGGASGVRAYPANEAGGSDGQLLNLELRWHLQQGLTLTAFHDWGNVTVNHNNAIAGAALLNNFSLSGNGLSLAWKISKGLSFSVSWATRQGDNPNPTASGRNDQDGSLIKNRVWLSTSIAL